MKNTFKKLTALAMSFALLGAGTTISKAIAPNSNNITTASAAGKHYYVLSCDDCGAAFSTGFLGTTFMKAHIHNHHGSGYYTRKDVCTAYGCHRDECYEESNNPKTYVK